MSSMKGFHFTKLSKSEQINIIQEVAKYKSNLLIWEKGSEEREKVHILSYDKDSSHLVLHSLQDLERDDLEEKKQMCFHFEYRGTQYLGEAFVHKGHIYYLDVPSSSCYKWERRKSFRVDLDKNDQVNIYLFGQIQHKIQYDHEKLLQEGFISHVVENISVSGVAFQISSMTQWSSLIDSSLYDIILYFLGEWYIIPKAKVVRIQTITREKTHYIVALNFEKMPLELEKTLSIKIDSMVRKKDLFTSFEEGLLKNREANRE